MATEDSAPRNDWSIVEILPPEIAVLIFSNVPLRDIGRISMSCKTWNYYANEESSWKKIYELKYSTTQINSAVHPTLSWRELFYGARYAYKWSKKNCYLKCANEFIFSPLESEERRSFVTQNGLYEIFSTSSYVALTDVKMAGKISPAASKRNPISLYSGDSYGADDLPRNFKAMLVKHFDYRASKNGKYSVSNKISSWSDLKASNGRGDFLLQVKDRLVLWQAEVHGLGAQNYPPILSILSTLSPVPTDVRTWKFNQKYAMSCLNSQVCIIDLAKRCLHCNPMKHTGDNYKPELKNCDKECAVVYQGGNYDVIFASQLNPDRLVALTEKGKDEDWCITIWENGAIGATVPYTGSKGFDLASQKVNFIEHCTEVLGVKRHWFGTLVHSTYIFIDLNSLTTLKAIEAPDGQCLAWVPNENKVALARPQLITIIDLDTDTWYSTMKFPYRLPISNLTFNKTGQILFVSCGGDINPCYWKSGLVLEPIAYARTEHRSVALALDQILIVSDSRSSFYFTLKSKLEI